MTKVIKKLNAANLSQESLLNEIKNICLSNPQSTVAVRIKNLLDKCAIPIQMDKDLLRRMTDPVCNMHDVAFELPHALLQKDYEILNNQILIEA